MYSEETKMEADVNFTVLGSKEQMMAEAQKVHNLARSILESDGYHTPMALVFSKDDPVSIFPLQPVFNMVPGPEGKNAAANALRKLGREVPKIYGFILILESYVHSGELDQHTSRQVMEGEITPKELLERGDKNTREALITTASFRGGIDFMYMTKFDKDDEGNVINMTEPDLMDSEGDTVPRGKFVRLFESQ
jgi:hypothetical protein